MLTLLHGTACHEAATALMKHKEKEEGASEKGSDATYVVAIDRQVLRHPFRPSAPCRW